MPLYWLIYICIVILTCSCTVTALLTLYCLFKRTRKFILYCVYWSLVPDPRLSLLLEMISHLTASILRLSGRCWRHGLFLKVTPGTSNLSGGRWYSTPGRGAVTGMEAILARVVAPLPTYETRDKSPPPPESNSLEFMHFYSSLDMKDKVALLTKLSQDYGVEHRSVSELAVKLQDAQLRDLATILQVEDRLRYSLTPRYKQLLSHISRVEGGVKFLVDLRADVLEIISSKASDSPHVRVKCLFTFFYGCSQGLSRSGLCQCWCSCWIVQTFEWLYADFLF